ncbi:MAG: phosphate/phosphite/phosphonate ABC transporter substrate-binding protein [Methylococcales bacterium]|jgi:phosphonate transport system substrate-binding protein|nr:phosphate/phosphite/phosphonate ABC transporter substrate-binding protein [Methylococcales bacterium]MBT7409231.1 phosphate/phosphite/phosphonate ABC transporter substrate-binding protein [Methylococcales bacterium]
MQNVFKKPIYLFVLIVFFLISCGDENQFSYQPEFSDSSPIASEPEYIFGVHPLHNPQRLQEVFGPLMDYLSEHIDNARFKLEASRNYAAYDKKLYAHKFHFSLPNPFQTINAIKKGYKVFGKMGDDENFRGIILVRKDSGIEKVTDLIGKAVSYPAPTALAATMMPQYYLQMHGVDVVKQLDNRYVGSQESSIMNVYLKNTVAGATWPPPWSALSEERPELKKELKVIWQTPHLPNNGLVVLPNVPASVVNKVSQLLFNLHQVEKGKKILAVMHLSSFESANNATYQSVRDFIVKFSEKVRPIEY